jgi:hypothetical protein
VNLRRPKSLVSRDERIDGNEAMGHLPKYVARNITYRCITCDEACDGAALYCRDHLANLVLRP